MDGNWMHRKVSPCTITAGQFCIDYAAKEIYIATLPIGHLLEYSTVTGLFASRYDDVTVKDLAYTEFATAGGAVSAGGGWRVQDVHGYHKTPAASWPARAAGPIPP